VDSKRTADGIRARDRRGTCEGRVAGDVRGEWKSRFAHAGMCSAGDALRRRGADVRANDEYDGRIAMMLCSKDTTYLSRARFVLFVGVNVKFEARMRAKAVFTKRRGPFVISQLVAGKDPHCDRPTTTLSYSLSTSSTAHSCDSLPFVALSLHRTSTLPLLGFRSLIYRHRASTPAHLRTRRIRHTQCCTTLY